MAKSSRSFSLRRAKPRCIAVAVFLALVLVLAGCPGLWLPGVARWLAVGDRVLEPAEVIIVLSGERGERVETAVRVYRKRLTPRLLLTGGPVEWNLPAAEIMAWQAESLGVPRRDMVLERQAASTYENALYSLEILKEKGWRSAIVVTSPYHLRRTRFIFERVFAGEAMHLSFCGAEDPWLVPERWWRQDRGLEAVGMEYLKLVAYYIRYGPLSRLAKIF